MNVGVAPAPGAIVGLVTIGQSPRPDLCEALRRSLPQSVAVIEAGVLDGLPAEVIEGSFTPRVGEGALISRLSNGRQVVLGAAAVERGMQRVVDELDRRGVAAIVVLCTGSFPGLRSGCAQLIEPDELLCKAIAIMLNGDRLGVMAPLQEQIPMARAKWRTVDRALACEAASPYGDMAAVVATARRLCQQGAQLLVLDCMGYGRHHRQALLDAGIDIPVLVSADVIASAVARMFEPLSPA